MKNKGPHIVVTGNPSDGFQHIGPFPSFDSARLWAEERRWSLGDWWIAALTVPTGEIK